MVIRTLRTSSANIGIFRQYGNFSNRSCSGLEIQQPALWMQQPVGTNHRPKTTRINCRFIKGSDNWMISSTNESQSRVECTIHAHGSRAVQTRQTANSVVHKTLPARRRILVRSTSWTFQGCSLADSQCDLITQTKTLLLVSFSKLTSQ